MRSGVPEDPIAPDHNSIGIPQLCGACMFPGLETSPATSTRLSSLKLPGLASMLRQAIRRSGQTTVFGGGETAEQPNIDCLRKGTDGMQTISAGGAFRVQEGQATAAVPSMEALLGCHVDLRAVRKVGEGTFGEAFKV